MVAVILKDVFDIHSGSQDVCVPVSFANNCLEYTVALTQSKGYFVPFKHFQRFEE